MSYLYEHREQLGENSRLAEIAYSVTFSIPPDDRDDVEQVIVIGLIEVKKKVAAESYLWQAARHMVAHYWESYYRSRNKSTYIEESNRGEVAGIKHLSASNNDEGRLDAVLTLSTLPPRLVEIGLKKLNGEKLTNAERLYRNKRRNKLRPNRTGGRRLSKEDEQKVMELNRKGLPTSEIVRITGWSVPSVKSILKEAGLTSAYPAQAERVRAEKEVMIKQAYFVEGKSISQIAIETHTWRKTVRQVVKAGKKELATAV